METKHKSVNTETLWTDHHGIKREIVDRDGPYIVYRDASDFIVVDARDRDLYGWHSTIAYGALTPAVTEMRRLASVGA